MERGKTTGQQEMLQNPRKKSTEFVILKHIETDLVFIKQKIASLEDEIEGISSDMHKVRPGYVKKLQALLKEGRFSSFKNIGELRREIEGGNPI